MTLSKLCLKMIQATNVAVVLVMTGCRLCQFVQSIQNLRSKLAALWCPVDQEMPKTDPMIVGARDKSLPDADQIKKLALMEYP